MGVCQPQSRKAEFTAYFSANLRQLFEYYKKLLDYLKPSKLFSQPSEQLNLLVDTYLANPKIVDKQNFGLCSVDSVHKLHPIDYDTAKVTKQWLVDACLRQDKFIQEFPSQLLKFEECYRHYVEFLYLVFKNPGSVIVPNKLADFMWHSHMQDNLRYKQDCKKMLKKVLNHTDDFTQEQMKLYGQETDKARKRLLRQPMRKSVAMQSGSTSYHNFAFINYGYGMCGGGYYPINNHDTHPYHPQNKDSHPHHPDHHHNDTHPHHNDHHSNDHGGHHSNCGGGNSSCGGGGASSCGGGGSSCGGGGSSCGGGCGGGD